MEKNSRIFVCGHRGLVGSAVVRALEARGYTNLLLRGHKELDLSEQKATAAFFSKEKPEYVFLAAAKVGGILANDRYRAEFIYENLMIQTNVIHQSYLSGVTRLLFLGSSCIYPKEAIQPIKEEYLMTGVLEQTNSAYAVAKIAGVEMCQAYNRQYGALFVPVMPSNLYGSNDNFDLETSHVLPALIRKLHLAKLAAQKDWEAIEKDERLFGPIPEDLKQSLGIPPRTARKPAIVLWGTGKPRREFLHVDDLAAAMLFLMNLPEQRLHAADERGAFLFNIGTDKDISIGEMARMVAGVVGAGADIELDVSKPDGTFRKLLDTGRMTGLGWTPAIKLRDGIEKTYEWYRNASGAGGP